MDLKSEVEVKVEVIECPEGIENNGQSLGQKTTQEEIQVLLLLFFF